MRYFVWPSLRVIVCVTALLLHTQSVYAQQNASPAQALVVQGLQARREGHDQQAIALFQQAYALEPRASTAAQIGFALQALGQWIEAEVQLNRVRIMSDPWIDRHRTTIDDALVAVRAQLGWVEVLGQPAGAQVLISGRVVGQLPLEAPLRIATGTATLTVTSEGYYPIERAITIQADGHARETVTLEPRGAVVPPTVAISPPNRSALETHRDQSPIPLRTGPQGSRDVPRVSRRSNTALVLGSTLVGTGALSMVVAIPFWLLRNGGLQRLVELGCVESMSTVDCPRGGMEPQLIQQYSDAQSANTAATALAIAGGTLIGAGLTALVIYAATPRAERTHSTRVRVECNASTCGVVF